MARRRGGWLSALVPYGLAVAIGGGVALWLQLDLEAQRQGRTLDLQDPWALGLFASVLVLGWVGLHLRVRRSAAFSFSRVHDLARGRPGLVSRLASLPRVLRLVAVGLLAFALARPQTSQRREVEVEGIDIMLIVDLSKSMEERDLRPDRLAAAKRTIRRFIKGRPEDRIGLAIFAREAMLACPLTLDHAALDQIVGGLAIGDVEALGTAIGDGLGVGLAALRRSDARSKVAVLLSDGDSNTTLELDPGEAAEAAREAGVKVFTVLIGQEQDPDASADVFGRPAHGVNPALLQQIARVTGGRYLNAADAASLDRRFDEVRATLEKSRRREVGRIYGELFPRAVAPALILLVLEVALALTRFRRFP